MPAARSGFAAAALTLGTLGLLYTPQLLPAAPAAPVDSAPAPPQRGALISDSAGVAEVDLLKQELTEMKREHNEMKKQLAQLLDRPGAVWRPSTPGMLAAAQREGDDGGSGRGIYRGPDLAPLAHDSAAVNISELLEKFRNYPLPPPITDKNYDDWLKNLANLESVCVPASDLWQTKWKYTVAVALLLVLILISGSMYQVCAGHCAQGACSGADEGDDTGACRPPDELVVCQCPWGFVRVVHYFKVSDIFRQHTSYNPDELGTKDMNVYRLIALISPDLNCFNHPEQMHNCDNVTLPSFLGWLTIVLVTVCIILMQLYVPWQMVWDSWERNHLVGVKRTSYFRSMPWDDLMWRAVPLILLGSKHFVVVEKTIREEVNQCFYLWNAASNYKIQYGMGRTEKNKLLLGKLWSQLWVLISFSINTYVATMMTIYVVHSIAVNDPEKSLLDLVLKLVGSLGIIEYDDKMMGCLPAWSNWYLMHHPKSRKAHAGGKAGDDAANGSGDEDDDHLRQVDDRRVLHGYRSLLIPRKWRNIPCDDADKGRNQDIAFAKQHHGALWRAIDLEGDPKGTFLKLGFRFKDGKVIYVCSSRHDLYWTEAHRETTKIKAKLQTACHTAAWRAGDHPMSKLFPEGRAKGLKLGDEILFITHGHGMLEQSTSSKPDSDKEQEDPKARVLGWRVVDECQKDKIIAKALSTLRGPDKDKWRHPKFLVLVKPEKDETEDNWEYDMLWFADSVHSLFYILTRCLMVGSLFFIFMVYYTNDYGDHLGV
eukprot:TRINITY_DN60675_c0_g1_i1.p1 TRINITY_DN60675_c0_g1~~TRINITY_DN60675_c0_g1_i1.p1  ORF type:complete len:817 (+),score=188.22 TRINITY_DN60675_c0_g1_i1:153-2453(+)